MAKCLHELMGPTNVKKNKSKKEVKKEVTTLENPELPKPTLIWTSEYEVAFDTLKIALTTAPVLKYPDFTREFILEIDASIRGLGAVLSQKDNTGEVMAYMSQTFKPSEQSMHKYSSVKLELLALKWAVTEKFRDYLLGFKFIVYTDYNLLAYMQTNSQAQHTSPV